PIVTRHVSEAGCGVYGIAAGVWLSIGYVDHDRWKTTGMLIDPSLRNLLCLGKCLAHRCSTIGNGIEPDWKPHRLFSEPTCSVAHLLRPRFDAGWRARDFADWDEVLTS